MEEGSEDEKELCKNVKRVMEVIVGLLRERLDVEKKPAIKKQRVQGFFMYHGHSPDLCIYFSHVLIKIFFKIVHNPFHLELNLRWR